MVSKSIELLRHTFNQREQALHAITHARLFSIVNKISKLFSVLLMDIDTHAQGSEKTPTFRRELNIPLLIYRIYPREAAAL